MKLIQFFSLLFLATLMGCASATIMPQADGSVLAVYDSADKDDAQQVLVDSANKHCKEQNKTAVFLTESKTEYKGSMDEKTRNTVRKASQAGMILGGAGTIPDGTRTAGAVLGTAGTVGMVMTSDKDYKSQVRFKCQ